MATTNEVSTSSVTEYSRRIGSLIVVLLFATVVIGAGAGTASAAKTVSSCTTINSSNAPADGLVKLGSDINNAGQNKCINVTTSNIVFDGQGNLLDGTDTPGSFGINVSGTTTITNVTIRDIRIKDWQRGIQLFGPDNNWVNDTRVEDTEINSLINFGYGVVGFSSYNTTVENVTIKNSKVFGMSLQGSATITDSVVKNVCCTAFSTNANSTVTDNMAANITDTFQRSFNIGPDSVVIGNKAVNSTAEGHTGFSPGQGSRYEDNVAKNINGSGYNPSQDTVLINNTAINTTQEAFASDSNGKTTYIGNVARNSSEQGFLIDAPNSTLRNNLAVSNERSGIKVRTDAYNVTLYNNTVLDNNQGGLSASKEAGIYINGSPNSNVRKNKVHRNRIAGVTIVFSNRTKVRNNRITENCGGKFGVAVADTADALFVGNNVSNNTGTGMATLLGTPNLTVRDSKFNSNGAGGLSVGGKNATISGVVARRNSRLGIGVKSDDYPTITDTVVADNGLAEASFATVSATNFTVGSVTYTSLKARNTEYSDSTGGPSAPSGLDRVTENILITSASILNSAPFADVIINYSESFNDTTVGIYRYNSTTSSWSEVSGSTVDAGANTVSANITSFSTFAVFGNKTSLADTIAGRDNKIDNLEILDAIKKWRTGQKVAGQTISNIEILDLIRKWRTGAMV